MDCPLALYKIEGVEFSCEDAGHGCFFYSKVCTGSLAGLPCTAKQVDKTILGLNAAAEDLMERYADYCATISQLKHPHIVQFLGLSYKTDSPVNVALVCELLPLSVSGVLKRYNRLPDELSYSILRDVSLGLSYLHSRDVYHGDLCATSVLLSSDLTAKLSDIAISTVLKLSPLERKRYGSIAHLAPELLTVSGKPTNKIDCFAFGALIVHILSGKYPENLSCDLTTENPLVNVNADHPLASLALHCLNKLSDLRPISSQILATVSELMLGFPSPSLERRVGLLCRVVESGSCHKPRVVERKDSIVTLSNTIEIEHLKLRIEELAVENRGLRTSLKKQAGVINARDQEMAAKLMAKDTEILSAQQEMGALEATLSSHQATISVKEASVAGLSAQLKHLQHYIANKREVSVCSSVYCTVCTVLSVCLCTVL